MSSNGLKSFNFSGIKDRLLPGKRHTRLEPPKPIHRQIGNVQSSWTSSGSSLPSPSDSSSTLVRASTTSTTLDPAPGRKSTSSNATIKSRRGGSIDSGSLKSSDHGHGEDHEHTPRRKLMSLLHRTGSPRNSPSLVSSAFHCQPIFTNLYAETNITPSTIQLTELNFMFLFSDHFSLACPASFTRSIHSRQCRMRLYCSAVQNIDTSPD